MFRIHEKYIIRHRILEYLSRKIVYYEGKENVVELNDTNTPFREVIEAIGVPFEKAHMYHYALHIKDGEHVLCKTHNGVPYIGLMENGVAAVINEYWLREGQKELKERIYDKTKWLVPVLALALTLGSILYSATKVQGMQEKVSKLKGEIEMLGRQQTPAAGTYVPHR